MAAIQQRSFSNIIDDTVRTIGEGVTGNLSIPFVFKGYRYTTFNQRDLASIRTDVTNKVNSVFRYNFDQQLRSVVMNDSISEFSNILVGSCVRQIAFNVATGEGLRFDGLSALYYQASSVRKGTAVWSFLPALPVSDDYDSASPMLYINPARLPSVDQIRALTGTTLRPFLPQ